MHVLRALLIAGLGAATAGLAADANPPGTIQLKGQALNWQAAPANLPRGFEVAVLEGSPRAGSGLFTMRLRGPAGSRLAPHTHPQPERITVISGKVGVGFGKTFDPAALALFGPGDFYVNPPGALHYVSFVEDSVVQVTGEAPWAIDFAPTDRSSSAHQAE